MKTFMTILGLLGLDQMSKYLVRMSLETEKEIFSFFSLNFVENEGIAFSIPFPPLILIFLTMIFIFFMGYYLWTKKLKKFEYIALILIISGAFGNLIDRILWGKVTDFLAFWNFPIFNFADIYISVGVGIYLAWELFGNHQKSESIDSK